MSQTNPVDTPLAAFRRLQQLAKPPILTVVPVSMLLATSALIFWLWLVMVPARVAKLCPVGCECVIGGYEVICFGASVNPLPLFHITHNRVLFLHHYNTTMLKKDSFVSLTELRELYIATCGLRTIELGAFNGLTNLRDLQISHNDIRQILSGTFQNMKNLEYIGLLKNKIEHLDSDVFRGLFKLRLLDLRDNNLQYLHPDTILGLPNMEGIQLYGNRGLQVPTDCPFIKSHSLSVLLMSLCNVSSVSVETFANVSALEKLDLKSNYLKTVDINILRALPKLSEMYLYGNPLQCDCQLLEVWRWCKDHNIRGETGYLNLHRYFGETPPKCESPKEVEGMFWVVLDKGRCLEGNIEFYGDYKNLKPNYKVYDFNRYEFVFKRYEVPLYGFAFIFGTISNVIILIIIICNKDMRTIPNVYIINLAISDVIYLTVLFSEACANKISDGWLEGEFMCAFIPFCRRMSVGLSAYSVAVFSFQRYRVTVYPFQVIVSSPPTWRVTVATVCGVWIVAALFAVPSAISKYLCPYSYLRVQRNMDSRRIYYYRNVIIFELLVSCVLPLCVVAFSYLMTARHLVESSRSISEGTQNPQLETRRNTAKTVVGLAFVFLISIVPYHIFWTHFIYSEKVGVSNSITDTLQYSEHKFQYTYLISTFFLLINSCFNPVALFCTSSPLRQHLKRYLSCFCKTNSTSTDFELTRRN